MLHSVKQNRKWPAQWLHDPCRLGDGQCFRAGHKVRSGPEVGQVATKPLPSAGVPYASEQGTKIEGANRWAQWLHNPDRLWDPRCFTAGDKVRSGAQVGPVAT